MSNEIEIKENISMKDRTTFGIGGPARYFLEAGTPEELIKAFNFADQKTIPVFILGGGSNILISDVGFPGLVVSVRNKGIEVIEENDNEVKIKVGSSEVWDEVVEYAVNHGWWGIENLSHIPGKTGGVPVQNVGAYGQEAKNVIESVEVFDVKNKVVKRITNNECAFGYRKSIFNKEAKGKFVVLSTIFKLKKQGEPNITYPDVIKYFKEKNIIAPTLEQVRKAIISIRDNKLPNPKIIGNAGSFFKNIVLSNNEYQELLGNMQKNFSNEVMQKITELKNKFSTDESIKIPAAFVIDICGLKGQKVGGAKVNEKQALVIVNDNNNATAKDVLELAKKVTTTVQEKTGIYITLEPELIGFTDKELQEYLS